MRPLSRSEIEKLYPDNEIDRTAIIYPGVVMGKYNYIGPQCIIGGPAEKIGYFDHIGKVVIGNNCNFTKQVTIDSGTKRPTILYNNILILKNGHIGHDAVIQSDCIFSCNVAVGGWCIIGNNVGMGLGAMTHQQTEVMPYCYLGMGCVYIKSTEVAPKMTYVGNPASILGPNKKYI